MHAFRIIPGMKTDFDDLHKRSQDNLVRFLQVEIELARTFLKMADSTDDSGHRDHLLGTVREAIETVDRYEGRIGDLLIRNDIHREAGKLKKVAPRPRRVRSVTKARRVRLGETPDNPWRTR